MFGFSRHKRRQLQLQCPHCGNEQTEPGLAISSFCRACGEHFKIDKGVAVRPPGWRTSGVVVIDENGVDHPDDRPRPVKAAAPGTNGSGRGQTWLDTLGKAPAVAPTIDPVDGATPSPDATPAEIGDLAETRPLVDLGREAQPVEALRQGSMSAMFGVAMERLTPEPNGAGDFRPKMPTSFVVSEKGRKDKPQSRLVRCFECHHLQGVSLAATSTQCARCSIYISLADHEITTAWSQRIRTRGNVHIRKKGKVTGCDVACHDLEVDGTITASVDCAGDALFRGKGRITGHMHCRHLVVESRAEVAFPQGVIAESADIHGTVRGNITCAGTIRIFKNGTVEGQALARAIDLKEGGTLSGRMSVQPQVDVALPEKEGYRQKD